MSYTESILIPKEIFEKHYIRKPRSKNPEENILSDPALSSEKKIKLLKQSRHFNKIGKEHKQPVLKTLSIYGAIADEYKPFAHNIIQIIKQHPHRIRWDDEHRLIVNYK